MTDNTLERSRVMRGGKRSPVPVSDNFNVKDTVFEYEPGTDRISKLTQYIEMHDGDVRTRVQEFTYDGSGNVTNINQYFEPTQEIF